MKNKPPLTLNSTQLNSHTLNFLLDIIEERNFPMEGKTIISPNAITNRGILGSKVVRKIYISL